MQPISHSILRLHQINLALPVVCSGQGGIPCPQPHAHNVWRLWVEPMSQAKAFWFCLYVSGSLYHVFILLSVFPACPCMCLLPEHHSYPFTAPSPDSSGLPGRSYERVGAMKLCKYSFCSQKLSAIPATGQLLSSGLGGGIGAPFLLPSKSSPLLRLARVPKNHKARFSSSTEQFCSLCLIPASFKLCPHGLYNWKGTSGFCISPNRLFSKMNSATSY